MLFLYSDFCKFKQLLKVEIFYGIDVYSGPLIQGDTVKFRDLRTRGDLPAEHININKNVYQDTL
jgi:hypothetical protein